MSTARPSTKPKSTATGKRIYLDNSMLTDYRKCPRYFYLRHIRDWASADMRRPLIFGAAWHAAVATIWQGFKKLDEEKLARLAYEQFMVKWVEEGGPAEMSLVQIEEWNPRTPMVAAEMIVNYIKERASILERAKVLQIEQPFAVPLFSDRDDVFIIGRKDARVVINDLTLIEHKTTTEYKKDGGFKLSFTESFSPNSQLETYLFSESVGEKKPAKTIWVDAALVHKTVHDKFKFIPVSYATEAMDAWLWETRDWANRIISEKARLEGASKTATHMTAFPRNDFSCQGKYGRCQFLDICRSEPNPAKLKRPPEGFKEDHWEPFDVLGLDKIMKR